MATQDKLERYLETFDPRELKRFGEFLDSPYFKVDPAIREFGTRYLRWYMAEEKPHEESSVAVWETVFEGTEFNDGKWRKLRSKLLDSIEAFLVQAALESEANGLRQTNLLLSELDHRGLDKDFEQKLTKAIEGVSDEGIIAENDLVERTRLWEHCFNYHTMRQDPTEDRSVDATFLEKRMKAFRRQVMFDTLKTVTGLENRRYMGKAGFSVDLPVGFVEFLSEERRGKSPLIRCYVMLLEALEESQTSRIEPFLVEFLSVAPKLPPAEKAQLFNFAANLLIRQYLREYERTCARRLLDLYRLGIQERILVDPKGLIPVIHFKNICVIGCRFKETDFVSQFISQYAALLPKSEESIDVLGYCEALLLFSRGDFSGCWMRLNDVASRKYLKMEIKSLGIKAQYELGNMEVLETQLSSYERWLQRSTLPTMRKDAQLKRIRVLRKIINLQPGNQRQRAKLLNLIKEEGFLDSDWLIEKLNAK